MPLARDTEIDSFYVIFDEFNYFISEDLVRLFIFASS